MADNLISPSRPGSWLLLCLIYCFLLAAPIPPCPHLFSVSLPFVSTLLFQPLIDAVVPTPESPPPPPGRLSAAGLRPIDRLVMQVRCDVCGAAPAAVLCCADEAALCSACDRRVHRANKLADKHRRIPLVQPASGDDSSDEAAPLCDVCKERRGLVFCVEDRAILCPDCDDPIHTANDLTAKHTRFLLVGPKLSAALVDQAPPSPAAAEDDDDCNAAAAAEPDAVPAVCAANKASALEVGGGGGSSISDYLTNICPGWRVDDLLFDDPAFSAAASKAGGYIDNDGHEQVPSLDADLFDVVAGGRPGKRSAGAALGFDKQVPPASVVVVPTVAAKQQQQGWCVRERSWNSDIDSDSDVFAVPELPQLPPAKKARPAPAPTFWCF